MKWPFLIGIVIALVIGCMNAGIFLDSIGVAGCALYAVLPFIDRKYMRVRWATFTILFNGLFGVAYLSVHLMLHESWLVVSPHANHVIQSYLQTAGGIFWGITFTLIFSGQLLGTKREDKETSN